MSIETATGNSAQDITSRVESALFGSEVEPVGTDEDEVLDDAEGLPEDDDSDADDDEGSEKDKLAAIAEEEESTLASYLGLDDDRIVVDDDGATLFKAIIDGETKLVPLKELASSFQLQGHVNNKSMALETERKQFEEAQRSVVSQLQERIQGVDMLGKLAEQELVKEYESIDWNTLRHQDPANWTALRQEYAERAQKIQQVKELTTQEFARSQAEQAEKFQAQAATYFAAQQKAMIEDNPTWADEKVRSEKVGEMRNFLTNYGFTEEDALGINDHRLVRLIKDAQAYKAGLKAATEKKVVDKVLPKFQKPGSSQAISANMAKARAQKALVAKAKKTGNVNDIAASIVSRM